MVKTKKGLSIILSFIILMSGLICVAQSALAAQYKTVNGSFNYSYANEVLSLVNKERAANGLKPVTMTKSLTDGAMIRAAECSVSFSHTRPNGEDCFSAFSWTRAAGENIASGQRSPQEVMKGWMNSSGHRANILSSSFTTIGIGCFESGGILYWAQAFSGGSGSAYFPSGSLNVSVDVSLTSGTQSRAVFGSEESSTSPEKETTTKPSTTKPSTTKPSTTKPNTSNNSKKNTKNVFSRIIYLIRYYFR